MVEWKEVKLSDVAEIVGGATPSTKDDENYTGGNIAWITPKDLSNFTGRYISEGERCITEKGYNSCSTQMLPKHSVLFSSRAPIGYVAISDRQLCTNQGFKSAIPGPNIDYLFLYYLLKFKKDAIESMGSGTTFKEVSGNVMKNVLIEIPVDIDIQKKIACILDKIDSKIENNNSINRNLLEQADAIYVDMFVNVSEGTGRNGRLDELISVKYGKDHKKLADGVIPVYGSGGIMRYVERPLYTEESVLIPRKGSLNNVMYVNEPFWSVDTMFYTEMKVPNVAKFVYHFMKVKDLASMNAGSAVPSMTTDILNAMEVVIPSADKLCEFEELVSPLYTMIKSNMVQNIRLTNLRDTLLPKLMSGELDVSDLDI